MSKQTTTDRYSRKERQDRILAQLRSNVAVRILTLAEQFGVSTETVRRDIDSLTEKGLVNRSYGGATATLLASEPGILQRERRNVDERTRIARIAAGLIEPNDVLMIDGGSTTLEFARALATREIDLTVLTNCIPVAQTLAAVPNFKVTLCPGDFSAIEQGVYGQEASQFLLRFHANKAIVGAGGLTGAEITDADPKACWLKRTMIDRSERAIVLMDSSKFDVRLYETVCPLDKIDDFVTDKSPSRALANDLIRGQVALHIPSETQSATPWQGLDAGPGDDETPC